MTVSQSQPIPALRGADTEAEPAGAFTPAPWSHQPSEPDVTGRPITWYVVRGKGRYDPAIANTWPASEAPEADARLMAAAPDLLAVASAWIGYLDDADAADDARTEYLLLTCMRAAIAKALGASPASPASSPSRRLDEPTLPQPQPSGEAE